MRIIRGSSSLSVFKYPLQARTKDAHRELRGGASFVFFYKVQWKFYVLSVRMTSEMPV